MKLWKNGEARHVRVTHLLELAFEFEEKSGFVCLEICTTVIVVANGCIDWEVID